MKPEAKREQTAQQMADSVAAAIQAALRSRDATIAQLKQSNEQVKMRLHALEIVVSKR